MLSLQTNKVNDHLGTIFFSSTDKAEKKSKQRFEGGSVSNIMALATTLTNNVSDDLSSEGDL